VSLGRVTSHAWGGVVEAAGAAELSDLFGMVIAVVGLGTVRIS